MDLKKYGWVGSLITALLASSCCWLPFLLVGLGISGVAATSFLSEYRVLFLIVSVLFLATAFYYTYRPQRRKSSTNKFTAAKFNTVALWIATAGVVVIAFFPSFAASATTSGGNEKAACCPAKTDDKKKSEASVNSLSCTRGVAYAQTSPKDSTTKAQCATSDSKGKSCCPPSKK